MEEEKDRTLYELALLLKNEDDAARAAQWIEQHNGELVGEPRVKKLALAYKIKGFAEAAFLSCTFRAAGADAKSFEHDLRTQPEVIRSLIMIAIPPNERRDPMAAPAFATQRRMSRSVAEPRPVPSQPLSNEALTKKIEELL
jgi:ribosomal protein S6